MDLSDIETARHDNAPGQGDARDPLRWRELVGEMGAEIASPLTSALERINVLTTTGRIDRQGLRALREEVAKARQVAMASQQLARLASGRVRQSHERVDLPALLGDVLKHRAREVQARGIQVKVAPAGKAVEVLIDASLFFSLLNTLLDWALECTRSTIALGIDIKPWPAHARLHCRFAHRPVDQLDDGAPTPGETSLLDSMHWRLLQQTALTLGIAIERSIDADGTALGFEFPRTVNETMEGVSMVELDDGFSSSLNTRPLAGSHVLVVAQRREVRAPVREALRNMGLLIDFVESVAQAADFCRDGLPHAIVIESALCGERFAALRRDIAAEVPQFAFIEITEGKPSMAPAAGDGTSRVALDAIAQSLPAALLFELSRQG
ncbi:MAG: hypothetical protein M9915_05370 [Rhizobacter sp.]|nr:hypothetical protein [Rhizobacter sp.]